MSSFVSAVQPEMMPHTGVVPNQQAGSPAAAEALQQLARALAALRRLKAVEAARLDPWEAGSLAVAEQSLERAWLALSQLHADLHKAKGSRPERNLS